LTDLKVDRTAFCVTSLNDENEEKNYWLSQTPEKRLMAIEINRQIIYDYDSATARLQRFFEVAQLKPS